MMTVNLGPLAIPTAQLLLIMAMMVAMAVGYVDGRRRQTGGIGNILIDMLLVGLLAARVVFVAIWFDTYRNTPWSIIDIRDGGFTPWAGIVAALVMALWRGWRRPAIRQSLILGLAAGALTWGGMVTALRQVEKGRQVLPAITLTTPAGVPIDLVKLAGGKPLVLNLWATWCPPCRREMPVLAAAQKNDGRALYVFANQGEGKEVVLEFLSSQQLNLENVLLDPRTTLGKAVGSKGLPTTLFYNASGQLVDTHLGELSAASLASKVQHILSTSTVTPKE